MTSNTPLTAADWASLERQGLVKRPASPPSDAILRQTIQSKHKPYVRKPSPPVGSPRGEDSRSGANWMTPGRRDWLDRNQARRMAKAGVRPATPPPEPQCLGPKCCVPLCQAPAKFNEALGRHVKKCVIHSGADASATRIAKGRPDVPPVAKPREKTHKGMLQILDLIDRRICARVPMTSDVAGKAARDAYDDALAIVREVRKGVAG